MYEGDGCGWPTGQAAVRCVPDCDRRQRSAASVELRNRARHLEERRAACLPIDRRLPEERQDLILSDAPPLLVMRGAMGSGGSRPNWPGPGVRHRVPADGSRSPPDPQPVHRRSRPGMIWNGSRGLRVHGVGGRSVKPERTALACRLPALAQGATNVVPDYGRGNRGHIGVFHKQEGTLRFSLLNHECRPHPALRAFGSTYLPAVDSVIHAFQT